MPRCRSLRRAVAGDAVAGDAEAGELLDVHVQQRSRPRPFVAAEALPLPSRPAREPMSPEHLPDRRASPTHDPRQPAWAEVGLAAGPQDRLLLAGAQPPRLAQRPRGAIDERRDDAPPSSQRCHQRCAVAGDTLKRAAARFSDIPASIASTSSRRPASPSLALACNFITALLWARVLADAHSLKGGPDDPSAVHNLCGQLS